MQITLLTIPILNSTPKSLVDTLLPPHPSGWIHIILVGLSTLMGIWTNDHSARVHNMLVTTSVDLCNLQWIFTMSIVSTLWLFNCWEGDLPLLDLAGEHASLWATLQLSTVPFQHSGEKARLSFTPFLKNCELDTMLPAKYLDTVLILTVNRATGLKRHPLEIGPRIESISVCHMDRGETFFYQLSQMEVEGIRFPYKEYFFLLSPFAQPYDCFCSTVAHHYRHCRDSKGN